MPASRLTHSSPCQTCDNTLELPHYWKALCFQSGQNDGEDNDQLEVALGDLLTCKLRTAIEYSEGYGLDGTSGMMLPGVGLVSHGSEEDAIEKEESYESLDLPALGSSDDVAQVAEVSTSSPEKEPSAVETSPLTPPTSDETVDDRGGEEEPGNHEDRDGHEDHEDHEEEQGEAVLVSPAGRQEESYEENDWEEEG
jgi:hypothetical protein